MADQRVRQSATEMTSDTLFAQSMNVIKRMAGWQNCGAHGRGCNQTACRWGCASEQLARLHYTCFVVTALVHA